MKSERAVTGMKRGQDQKTLCDQVLEAKSKIRRQLEILKGQASSGDFWGDNRKLIAKLEAELRDLHEIYSTLVEAKSKN